MPETGLRLAVVQMWQQVLWVPESLENTTPPISTAQLAFKSAYLIAKQAGTVFIQKARGLGAQL